MITVITNRGMCCGMPYINKIIQAKYVKIERRVNIWRMMFILNVLCWTFAPNLNEPLVEMIAKLEV